MLPLRTVLTMRSKSVSAVNIGDLLDPNAASAFRDAEYGNLSRRTATAHAFALTAEVELAQFHFPTQKFFPILCFTENGQAKEGDSLGGRLITDTELAGHLPGRDFQFENLDHAEPLGAG